MRHFLTAALLFLLVVAPGLAHGDDDEPTGIKCGFIDAINNVKKGVAIQDGRIDTLEFIYRSPSGKFAIHYDLTGPHAVSPTDKDANGIPDYIDSTAFFFDLSYQEEVGTMGYLPPPSDLNGGGTPEYDIYVSDVGTDSGYYGVTILEAVVSSSGAFERWTTFIRIDNNFSADDRYDGRRVFYETGYKALKVTAAHEFHHAIQIGAYGNCSNYSIFLEMTSTWMEYRVFPEVRDYRQYLPRLFGNLATRSFGAANARDYGYDYGAVLGQFLYKGFGDELLRNVWEGVRHSVDPYTSLSNAFTAHSSSFATEWCKFLPWFYYTGQRAEGNTRFDSAAVYPLVTFGTVKTFSNPSAMLSGIMHPLEFRFVRIVLPRTDDATSDTLDIGMTNTNVAAAASLSVAPSLYEIVCSRESGGMPVPGTPYFLTLTNDDGNICFMPPVVNSGYSVRMSGPFPNPCNPASDGSVFFPVPAGADANAKITLTVFDAAMLPVFATTTSYKVVERSRVVEWDCRLPGGDIAADGVYVYTTECDGKVNVGKVAIIKK